MKTCLLLLITVMLCSFSGIRIKNSLNDQKLKGKVKSVTEYRFYDKLANKLSVKTTYQYDERGNEIARIIYENDSIFMSMVWDYKYNGNGIKTEENIYNRDGTLSWKTVYSYDKKGMLTEAKRYHDNGMMEEKYVYKYDSRGNNIEMDSYDTKGKPNCKSTFRYDDSNNLIEDVEDCGAISWLEGYNRVKSCNKYSNDAVTEHLEYNKDNSIIAHTKNSEMNFDATGNLIKWTAVMQNRGMQDTVNYKREISYY